MSKQLVRIDVCTSHAYGPGVVGINFYNMNCSTAVKVRDFFIKQERAEYVKTKDFEDEPASEAICKFPFGSKLVGFYHFDDGLTFLFEEGHPIFKLLAQQSNVDRKRLAQGLFELHRNHMDKMELCDA